MTQGFTSLLSSLLDPLRAPFAPEQRVFWPYLLGALALAAAVFFATARRRSPAALLGYLLPRRLWLSRSAVLDYKLLFVKAVLRAGLEAPRLVSTLAVAAAVALGLRRLLGDAPAISLSRFTIGLLLTLSAFLVEDWARYALHKWMHRIPALWEIHKVHHSAEVLTPVTLYRTHPIESLMNGARTALTVGVVMGAFVWCFGGRVRGWEVLGVDAIGFVWTLLGANLRHSHVWLSYGPRVEHVLMSPAQHQVHHSVDARHHDRNFGTALALWDWLGGSLYVTRGRERLRFGLPAPERNHGDGALSAVVSPLVAAGRVLWRGLQPLVVARSGAIALALLSLGLMSCVSKKIDRVALLQAFGECALDQYRQFDQRAAELATAAAAAATDPAARPAAQEAWRRAIDVWQVADLMNFGPAAVPPSPGGENYRDAIYSWPDVSRCVIEQQLVAKTWESPDAFAAAPSSTRGLSAVEYLLFYSGTDNACGSTVSINSDGTWQAIPPAELAARKAAYARVAAADVAARAKKLVNAWEPSQGNFLGQLTTAGTGSTVYTTQAGAINAVADGLFFLDQVTKDNKLGVPLGLTRCTQATCPEALESQWADRGKNHLAGNLAGFGKLLAGCGPAGAGLGFDDLLVAAGAESVATRMKTDLDEAQRAVAELPDPSLMKSLLNDKPSVQRVYDAIKDLTDALKAEFVMALAITPPGHVSGDHD